jgi:hypothetical protein
VYPSAPFPLSQSFVLAAPTDLLDVKKGSYVGAFTDSNNELDLEFKLEME